MTDWRVEAGCRDADPELFFPTSEDLRRPRVAEQVNAAKTVCAACPVWAECLSWAVTTGQTHGIWGLTTTERRHFTRGDTQVHPGRRSDGIPPAADVA